MRPHEVLNAYRAFWSSYQKLCQSAGVASKPTDGVFIQINNNRAAAGQVVIEANLYMPNWRSRGSAPSDQIHILVNSLETYVLASDSILKSSVQVLYSKAVGTTASPLLALHYDYQADAQAAHPIFHAQFGKGDFSSRNFQTMGFRFTVENSPKGVLYSSVRIPTPNMNLISVLLGLAADHIDPRFFKQFLKLVKDSPLTQWDAQCPALSASLQGGGRLPSHHWYATV